MQRAQRSRVEMHRLMQAANWASQAGEPLVEIRHWLYWARHDAVQAPPWASWTSATDGAEPAKPPAISTSMTSLRYNCGPPVSRAAT